MQIRQEHLNNAAELAREFQIAKPFRHLVLDNFLDEEFCKRLLNEFPGFDKKWALNESGLVGRKAAVPDIKGIGPAYREFDQLMQANDFLQFIGKVAGIDSLLYDAQYVGGGTHENLDGQELDLHVDFNFHPKKVWHRRLNLIVFLNPVWEPSWGGCLELHKDPWNPEADECVTVVPELNRAVLFETTESSWHGFRKITIPGDRQDLSRRSLAVYFYTKSRSVEETAVPHATVYVPLPLPKHLQAGYTLSKEDADVLKELIDRRNGQIRFLYERELEFSEAIHALTGSLSFRAGRLFTWPARWLRDQIR